MAENYNPKDPDWIHKEVGDEQTASEMNLVVNDFKSNSEVLQNIINLLSPLTELNTDAKQVIPAINELFSNMGSGSPLQLQTTATHIQWRESGGEWENLIAIEVLKGPAGESDPGEPGTDGVTPHIGANGNWWLDGVDTGVAAQPLMKTIYDDAISGIRNGVNNTFTVAEAYIPGTLKVWLNGSLMSKGNNADFMEHDPGHENNGAVINRIITPEHTLVFEYVPKVY